MTSWLFTVTSVLQTLYTLHLFSLLYLAHILIPTGIWGFELSKMSSVVYFKPQMYASQPFTRQSILFDFFEEEAQLQILVLTQMLEV